MLKTSIQIVIGIFLAVILIIGSFLAITFRGGRDFIETSKGGIYLYGGEEMDSPTPDGVPENSLVFVKKYDEYELGDVVLYKMNDKLHIGKIYNLTSPTFYYVTTPRELGDAGEHVIKHMIVGRCTQYSTGFYSIIKLAASLTGLIGFVIIPALLLFIMIAANIAAASSRRRAAERSRQGLPAKANRKGKTLMEVVTSEEDTADVKAMLSGNPEDILEKDDQISKKKSLYENFGQKLPPEERAPEPRELIIESIVPAEFEKGEGIDTGELNDGNSSGIEKNEDEKDAAAKPKEDEDAVSLNTMRLKPPFGRVKEAENSHKENTGEFDIKSESKEIKETEKIGDFRKVNRDAFEVLDEFASHSKNEKAEPAQKSDVKAENVKDTKDTKDTSNSAEIALVPHGNQEDDETPNFNDLLDMFK